MKKVIGLITGLIFMLPAWASVDVGSLLNKVTLQFQSEAWITTKTALVSISVNAAVPDQSIGNIQMDIIDKLKKLSDKSEWHIVNFSRQLDQSGLDKIQISAQARLPQTELAGLRDKTKNMSKPGETFTIADIQFIPSEEEIRQANILLRNNIYIQAKAEIDALNKTYPDQKYYLYNIDFISQLTNPAPMVNTMMLQKAGAAASFTPTAVGDKTVLQATVIIASMPTIFSQDSRIENLGK